MPGPVSDSYPGPPNGGPYVPHYLYKNGPKVCPCGHHEGYHNDRGQCIRARECHCAGLPPECLTPIEEME
jgi:hypothetical protein